MYSKLIFDKSTKNTQEKRIFDSIGGRYQTAGYPHVKGPQPYIIYEN